ncbi:MAG TPA: hypothetical protein PKO05_07085, partial [Thermoanaerobaculia bacterium]|nr:hypothetical protein [Thermoanaerobaculia bacterium]
MKILTAAGVGPTDTSLVISMTTPIYTVIVGVVVTVVCAIVPAIRSGRVPPLAAMRDVAVDRSGISRSRLITGAVLVAISAAAIAAGITSDAVWLGAGVAALFAALVVLGPLIAAPVARARSSGAPVRGHRRRRGRARRAGPVRHDPA